MDQNIRILDVGAVNLTASRSSQFDPKKDVQEVVWVSDLTERYGAEKIVFPGI